VRIDQVWISMMTRPVADCLRGNSTAVERRVWGLERIGRFIDKRRQVSRPHGRIQTVDVEQQRAPADKVLPATPH
jgi:hypothetical protein